MLQKEGIIKGRDDAEDIIKREEWCIGTLQKERDVKKEGIIKGRHDAGRHYKRLKERDGAKGH